MVLVVVMGDASSGIAFYSGGAEGNMSLDGKQWQAADSHQRGGNALVTR
jgi:hypothetical protein